MAAASVLRILPLLLPLPVSLLLSLREDNQSSAAGKTTTDRLRERRHRGVARASTRAFCGLSPYRPSGENVLTPRSYSLRVRNMAAGTEAEGLLRRAKHTDTPREA
jgi:hypothetical protein